MDGLTWGDLVQLGWAAPLIYVIVWKLVPALTAHTEAFTQLKDKIENHEETTALRQQHHEQLMDEKLNVVRTDVAYIRTRLNGATRGGP